MLGMVLKHIVAMANFSVVVNYAKLCAKSNVVGTTLQINDMAEKITESCWQCSLEKSS